MRPAVVLLTLSALALVTFPTPAGGQVAPPQPQALLEDAANDEGLTVQGTHSPASRWEATDLQALTGQESETAYLLTLKVRAFGDESTEADAIEYRIAFLAAGSPYSVTIYDDPANARMFGSLGKPDPDFPQFDEYVADVAVTKDKEAGTLQALVPRDQVLRPDGAPLFVGDALSAFSAFARDIFASQAQQLTQGNAQWQDQMPDDGTGTRPWIVAVGPELHGTVRAASPQPVRVSNGEATTFLYAVDVRNTADHVDTFQLKASGLPSNWVATFPQQEVRIDGGANQSVPVLLTVPFAHIHGAFYRFNLTVQSRSDPLTYAVVQLGVRYTAVPQPAGHHDTLFLHGKDQFYMNTLETEEVPQDEQQGTLGGGGCGFSSGGGTSGSSTIVPLFPDFDLGLDMDMARNGTASIVLHSQLPSPKAYSLTGYFLVFSGNDRPNTCTASPPEQAVAVLQRTAPLDIPANQDLLVTTPIQPLPYGDLIPHDANIHLWLVLVLVDEGVAHVPFCCLGEETPTFVAGSHFQLPLNEYHDPVNGYFSSLSGLDLRATSSQQRAVHPGRTALFRVEAQNVGDHEGTFDLELKGSHLEWTRILGDAQVTVPAQGKRELAVAVSPPADAPDKEVVDVTLNAVSHQDANVRSLIRLLATVDPSSDLPDEAPDLSSVDAALRTKHSPAPEFPALLAALAAAGLLLERRRRPGA